MTGGSNTVYVVDDEEPVRRSLALMLKVSGRDVTSFESGEEFLNALDGLPPACVLLDVRMPGLDGLEVQQELSRRGTEMPVIMMTGHGDLGVAITALRAGAADFLEKPFAKVTLMSAIERAAMMLSGPEQARALQQQAAGKVAALPDRDKAVLSGLAEGLPNTAVAEALGVSVVEVEESRAHLMDSLGIDNLSEAIRIAHFARL